MKKLISIIILAVVGTKAIAKPHCQNFNNYDDRVTITFTDDKVGKRYDVTDVVFIPSFFGGKLSATSVKVKIHLSISSCCALVYGLLSFFPRCFSTPSRVAI